MEGGTGNQVYRYRANRLSYGMYAFYVAAALMSLMWTCIFMGMLWWLYFTPAYRQAVLPTTTDLIFLITMSILMITNLVLWTGFIIAEILRTKRARIVVDATGLSLTDWRNRETHLDWDDIREVHVKTQIGRLIHAIDKIIVGPKRIWIRQGLENRQELLDEVIDRAHLTETSADWYQTRYSRLV